MALDYGERRVGVAISDPEGRIASPLETIERGRGKGSAITRVAELVREYEVGQIVIGLPLHMDGRSGPEVERVRAFGSQLARETGAGVEYLDERWTTLEAERAFAPAGGSKRRRAQKREKLDPVAAAILLRTWLERGGG